MLAVNGLRFKLLIYFFTLILLPFTTLGVLGNWVSSSTLEKEATRHTEQMIEQVQNNTEFYIKDMENIMKLLEAEPEVVDFLNQDQKQENLHKGSAETEIRRLMTNIQGNHPEIAGILLVNENDLDISNEMFRSSKDALTNESWFKEAIRTPLEYHFFSNPIGRNIKNRVNYSADEVVSIVKAIKEPDSGKYQGVILIDLKLEILETVIKGVTLGKNGFLFLMDNSGNVVYSPTNPVVYRVNPDWLHSTSQNIVKTISGKRFQILVSESKYTGWKTVGVFSLNDTLKEVTQVRNYSILLGLITLLLGIATAFFFTQSIVKPIGRLRGLMKEAEAGNLNVFFKSRSHDEIAELGNSFNNMIGEIRNLISQVFKEQKGKREAELRVLQEQIKPHFLYNTLDTIQWLAHEGKTDDIVKMIAALTNLFRIGLNKGKEMIRVEEEIEHIRSYLLIQKARYEDKLEYEIHIDKEIQDFLVLKLILQPLVENSIYHGIKARRGTGKIQIFAKRIEEKLIFTVKDDGVGISLQRLEQLKDLLKDGIPLSDKPAYGSFNINERIKLTFGQEYGLHMSSVEGEGTTVEIWHPIIKEGDRYVENANRR
ncbi:sensor histidine kinase [Neobacillus jeddahensis]|uniref:sensor histidine kinase n=1 Tax=Neobacillus jeddahensis TaxID=1461580 RepID=UPI000591190F|nr:sensor histidine kinase [Neobacillus jeddahensis]